MRLLGANHKSRLGHYRAGLVVGPGTVGRNGTYGRGSIEPLLPDVCIQAAPGSFVGIS